MIVDLSGVDMMDSSGLGELVAAYKSVSNRGGKLKLVSPVNQAAATALKAIGGAIPVLVSEAEALASF